MKNPVNTRILLLKTKLNLGQNEFCYKTEISTATLHSIQNDAEIRERTVRKIAFALNANSEWIFTGKGEMFLPEKKSELSMENPWKDEAFNAIKAENTRLEKEVNRLFDLIQSIVTSNGKGNFQQDPEQSSLVILKPAA